jgi:hypothetical protein
MARSVISIRMTTESWLEELEASDEYAQTHRAVGKYFKPKNDEDFAIVEFIGPYGEHQDPIPDKFNPGKTKIRIDLDYASMNSRLKISASKA